MKNTRIALAVMILATSFHAFADVSTFLTSTVPSRAEEALTWCGPAAGQSIMAGYPTGACTVLQSDVNDAIQARKVETSWDTDPAGLRGTLRDLCPLPPGHGWSIFAQPSATSIMYWTAHYMAVNHYPVAILLSTTSHNAITVHREHWVTVAGIVTNVDPVANSSVTLNFVYIYDQQPTLSTTANPRFLTGTQFYSEFQAVTIPGSAYNGKFVAIIEPPTREGTATAKTRLLAGAVISIARAAVAAQRAVQSTLANVPSFREAANLQPQEPLLVDAERGGYYIVPFAKSADARPSFAVLINAYDGSFLEAARTEGRGRFLREAEAIKRASTVLRRQVQPKARLVRDSDDPYAPSFRVNADNEELAVDVEGNVRRVIREKQPQ